MEMRNNFITKINLRITEFSFFFQEKKKPMKLRKFSKHFQIILPTYFRFSHL